MKKILYLLLFIPTLLTAQNRPDWDYDFSQPISVDFPVKLPALPNYVPTQNTFYEYNWVANNIRLLIEQNLKLNFQDQKQVWKDNYITDVYKTPAGRVIDELNVKYNTFDMYSLPIVESIEVTGSFDKVAKLFVWLYDTNFQSGNLPTDQLVKTYAQDNALFSLKDGKASIKITNSALKRTEFVSKFETEKEKFKQGLN